MALDIFAEVFGNEFAAESRQVIVRWQKSNPVHGIIEKHLGQVQVVCSVVFGQPLKKLASDFAALRFGLSIFGRREIQDQQFGLNAIRFFSQPGERAFVFPLVVGQQILVLFIPDSYRCLLKNLAGAKIGAIGNPDLAEGFPQLALDPRNRQLLAEFRHAVRDCKGVSRAGLVIDGAQHPFDQQQQNNKWN